MPDFKPIIIPIQTLTPIWTGDADRQTSYVKGTSIIGGLRFWTEALIRSFGGRVCDINGDGRCIHDPEKKNETCDACNIFGCTGLGRSFGLKIEGNGQKDAIGKIALPQCSYMGRYGKRKTPTWYLQDKGLQGGYAFKLTRTRNEQIAPELALTLALMLKWGTIGARDQYSHGIVKADLPETLIDMARSAIPNQAKVVKNSLQDFFFFNVLVNNAAKELPFEIRCKIRGSLRSMQKGKDTDKELRHYFCGNMMGSKNATKYNIGLANGRIRGWGCYPSSGRFSEHRDRCLNSLKIQIERHCGKDGLIWREFNSERDTVKKISDWPAFLKQLMGGK